MNRSIAKRKLSLLIFGVFCFVAIRLSARADDFKVSIRQVTSGEANHFFGYIGHVQNIPWNGNGRYILALRTTFQDHLPGVDDPADIVLIDANNEDSVKVVDQSRAWNPQQGTMFYWNPLEPDTQFFFNDRDPETGKVFCVLFDISKGPGGRRVKEYRYEDTPIGNSGIAQNGGHFLGINYARMARLRPVTGYRGAFDWTVGNAHPRDDGVFKVEVATGRRTLLVSFRRLAEVLAQSRRGVEVPPLFINHTLWNREDDLIFFFARGGWDGRGRKVNQAFFIEPDGSALRALKEHIGGHPEWDSGRRMIGRLGDRQILYDADKQLVIGQLGTPDLFPDPEGDIALSPDGEWFVNGFKDYKEKKNFYVIYRRRDGAHLRTPGFDIGRWASGDLRQDPSPCWNRTSDQILAPGLAQPNGTRQLFVITIAK